MNYERMLRKLRAHPGLWDEREKKVRRLIAACKRKLAASWEHQATLAADYRDQRRVI